MNQFLALLQRIKRQVAIASLVCATVGAIGVYLVIHRARHTFEHLEEDLAVMGTTADEILSHDNGSNQEDVLSALHYRIEKKSDAQGDQSLTEPERRLVAATWVEVEVDNGGFDQYFYNTDGDDVPIALAGLEEMGAKHQCALLSRAMVVFPNAKIPSDHKEREALMKKLHASAKPIWDECDKGFYATAEKITPLAIAYAKKNRAQILAPRIDAPPH